MADHSPESTVDRVGLWTCPHCTEEFVVTLRQARVHLRCCDQADIDYPPLAPTESEHDGGPDRG